MNLTDELTAPPGQPAEVVAPAPAEPTAPTAPVEVKQEVPTKYGGKTVEDLAREMAEKDDYISQVNERAARAEHEAQLTRNLVEQFARGQGRPQEQVPTAPDEPPIGDDDLISNPKAVFVKGFQWMESKMRAEREQERRGQYVNTARSAYEDGRAAALKSNPKIFQGIESKISEGVLDNVKHSLEAGNPVDVDTLRSPKFWESAAVAYRISEGEDLMSIANKYYGERKVLTPMTPTHTETPTSGTPPKAEMTLSPEQEELISKGHVTREQFMEAWKKERSIADGRKR
jgi:hypothetical protein